jgi:hypothetical protein
MNTLMCNLNFTHQSVNMPHHSNSKRTMMWQKLEQQVYSSNTCSFNPLIWRSFASNLAEKPLGMALYSKSACEGAWNLGVRHDALRRLIAHPIGGTEKRLKHPVRECNVKAFFKHGLIHARQPLIPLNQTD